MSKTSVPYTQLRLSPQRASRWLLLLAGYLVANFRKRSEHIRKLLPMGCRVYGQPLWLKVLRAEGRESSYGGLIHNQEDLADLCVSSTVNLCINSAQPGSSSIPGSSRYIPDSLSAASRLLLG